MSWTVNPITGQLQIVGGGLSGSASYTVGNLIDNGLTINRAVASDGSKQLVSSTTSLTELSYLTGVTSAVQTQLNSLIPLSYIGATSGVASLDGGGKVPLSQLPSTLMEFKGNWNPNTNSPLLADGTGVAGYTYWVSALRASAVTGLNDSSMINFQVGDLVVYNGSAWVLVTPAAGVQSVNGAQGAVTVNAINQLTGDVTAGPASGSASVATSLVATSNGTLTALSALTTASALVTVGTITSGTWNGTTVDVTHGGTGTATAFTKGSVVFAGTSGVYSQDNARIFWDDTNFRLGINTASPSNAALDVRPNVDATGGSIAFTSANGSNSISMGTSNGGTFRIVNQMSGSHTLLAITGSQDALTWGQAAKAAFMAIKPGGATPTSSPTMTLEQATSQTGSALEVWDNAGTSVKQASITHAGLGTFSNVIDSGLTASTALTANSSKQLTSSSTTDTELGYVHGVTSAIQTQIDGKLTKSAGDIAETSFTAADNQAVAANVTGLAFANATVRSFEAQVSVTRGTTYAKFKLDAIQRASDWAMDQSRTGDDTGLTFTITTAGQVQYTSTSTGSTAKVCFRALTTTV